MRAPHPQCPPSLWPSNWEYTCEHGLIHDYPQGAIGTIRLLPGQAPALGHAERVVPRVQPGDPHEVSKLVDWPRVGSGRGRVYDLPGESEPGG